LNRVVSRELQRSDLIEERWADIVGDDGGSDIFISATWLVFVRQPGPVDKLVLLKLVVHVLEAEIGLNRAVVGENHILSSIGLFNSQGSLNHYYFAYSTKESKICSAISQTSFPAIEGVLPETKTLNAVLCDYLMVTILDE